MNTKDMEVSRTTGHVFLFLLVCCVFVARAFPWDNDQKIEAIKGQLNRIVTNFNQGDIKESVKQFTKDVVYMANNANTIHGRKGVFNHLQNLSLSGVKLGENNFTAVNIVSTKFAHAIFKHKVLAQSGKEIRLARIMVLSEMIKKKWLIAAYMDNNH